MIKKVVIGAVALAVLGLAAVFIYAEIEDDNAPEELSLDDRDASGSTVPEPATLDGTWSVGEGSQVGYRVVEDFIGGLANAEAVGRTSEVAGTMQISGTTVTASEFVAQMASMKSDRAQRDGQFQGRIMDVASHPTATFELTEPIQLDAIPEEGVEVTVPATGDLTLRGTTRPVAVDLRARRDGGEIAVNGSIPVVFADYGIPNPSNAFVSTRDNGQLELLLVFRKQA